MLKAVASRKLADRVDINFPRAGHDDGRPGLKC